MSEPDSTHLGVVGETLPEAVLLIDGQGVVVAANRVARRVLTGRTDPCGRRLTDLVATEPSRVTSYLRTCSASRAIVPGALSVRRDGDLVHYRCEGAVVEPATDTRSALTFLRIRPREEADTRFALLNAKITELAKEVGSRVRAEAMLEGQRDVLELVARGATLDETLTELARIVRTQSPGRPRVTVRLGADDTAIGSTAGGQSPRVAFGDQAPGPGKATWGVPIPGRDQGQMGEIALDYSSSGPDPVDRTVAERMADIAGIAIERTRADQRIQALLESERAARAEAERASRTKDEFLAMVSHELRNPLNAITGWVQLLADDDLDPPSRVKAIETIERNVKLHATLINDLLDFSRVASGRLTLNTTATSLRAVVDKACETVLPEVENRGLTLECHVDGPDPACDVDPNRLQQAVTNILWNAIRFTPRGGTIVVSVSGDETVGRIRIRDTGCGIDPELLPSIFEAFQQAERGTTRRQGGLGLGLAIVRHIVELHGGRVEAESPGVGQGSTFTLTLPRHPVPETPGSPTASPPSAPSLAGVHVLAVEDLPDARELLELALERSGATVTSAGSAAAALTVVQQAAPDVLVCDIGLPDVDGYAFVREWRARAATRDRPAIALTAYGRDIDRRRALEAGFDRHLTKPVDPTQLLITVAELISDGRDAARS